ncbi:HEAT repeat domain-containing protein [Sphingomonas sp. DT-51]|uniref:HEAT repeat domain-containing protein n=1 Tax=Sphingomonas sp. DT-51 TaxID=3396165 RepID=UPI003F1BEE39
MFMDEEQYGPSSAFLTWVINEDAPLTGSEYAAENLSKVIALMTDKDTSNRDWAAFIIANLKLDTPVVRAALTICADDPDENVRAEAIRGLARIDAVAALPYIQRALAAPSVGMDIFEAAAIVADASLVKQLTNFATKCDDKIIADALQACRTGQPHPWYL